MNEKLLDYIQALSIRDKKTLSQKALKVAEESGELAKAVLSYDSAYATRHRFVDKHKILEEVTDTILTAISVAYDLGFSHEEIEEMIDKKSERWQELQQGEDNVDFPLPFELHVTVKYDDILKDFLEHFKNICQQLNVKPILLDLENTHGGSIKDVMTSSKFYGDNRSAYEEAQRIMEGLKQAGFDVLREKVETVPWHPGAPKKEGDIMPKNCYFEAHISCIISENQKEQLQEIANFEGAHLLKNVFKKLDEHKFVNMMTFRNYGDCFSKFEGQIKWITEVLTNNEIKYEKIITEFCIYDTKVSHDYLWLNK